MVKSCGQQGQVRGCGAQHEHRISCYCRSCMTYCKASAHVLNAGVFHTADTSESVGLHTAIPDDGTNSHCDLDITNIQHSEAGGWQVSFCSTWITRRHALHIMLVHLYSCCSIHPVSLQVQSSFHTMERYPCWQVIAIE